MSAPNLVTTVEIEGAQMQVITKSLTLEVEGDSPISGVDFLDTQGLD